MPFVPGTFASTIEYVLRSFTKEYKEKRIILEICNDGSMHSFKKMDHILSGDVLAKHILSSESTDTILTPIYPFKDLHADETVKLINETVSESTKIVFIYNNDIESAEITMLFQYYKIAIGLGLGFNIFCGNNQDNITNWNSNYTHWSNMQVWELREWLSIFYPLWIKEWVTAINYNPRGIKISTNDILNNTSNTFKKIINYCELTEDIPVDNFATEWREKQQYVLDEYILIKQIVDCLILNRELSWRKLNIVSEAIIQQKLRSNGFEIKCWGLNEFPTDTKTLGSLLESNI